MAGDHDTEVVEGRGEEISTELTIAPTTPATLFRTDDPVTVLARATEVADALKDVIQKQRLYVNIAKKSHVTVEGWQTLGAMLGVTGVCEWTRPVENGWEARVEARTLDGRTIGAAEAQCLSTEGKPWNTAESFAIRSMAQTRAMSKALASVLRFVVTLAGYQGTPAEEAEGGMPSERQEIAKESKPQGEPLPADRVNAIGKAIGALGLTYGKIDLLLGSCGIDGLRAASGKALRERIESLTEEQADALEAELGRSADA